MKHILRSKDKKTVLSIQPGRQYLKIGSDFDNDKLREFLKLIDVFIEDILNEDSSCYGHFSFTKDSVEITLSEDENTPSINDLSYKRRWNNG
jgi:hypothetical protein